ncbi:MAG TPA: FtsX-like permease family protein [Elusimicrobiota bacterium]|nr:FtsX-like permease family protein [Elusimicrobiota bacterium]
MWLLAWRNVWRNRRRSLFTVLSIGSGLAAILFGQSLIETIQVQLVEKATGVFSGHLQVLARGVGDLKLPDKRIEDPGPVARALEVAPGVAGWERRWVGTGLASSKKDSVGVLVCGMEPEKDRTLMSIASYLVRGTFLGRETDGALIGEKLAAQLGVDLGGELVLMASAIDGSIGAEVLKVRGIYRTGSQTFDASIVYAPLSAVQRLHDAGARVNQFVARVSDPARLDQVRDGLARSLRGLPVAVLTWKDVDHELVGVQRYQDAILNVILAVVFAIVGLGILNTMFMSMLERTREFGLLMAMGARRGTVLRMVAAESLLLGALGAAAGAAAGWALIAYYGRTGLALPVGDAVGFFMPFDRVLYLRPVWGRHAFALAAVLAASALSGLPAALRAARMSPADSLRSV